MSRFLKPLVRTRTRKITLGLVVVALAGAGAAFAAWMVLASGTGGAKTGTLQALTITPDLAAAAANPLYPGQTGPLYIKVTNPNPTPVYLATTGAPISASSPSVTGGACNTSDFSFAPSYFSPSLTIPANATDQAFALPGMVTLNPNAPTGCQGVTVTEQVSGTASLTNS